MKNIETELFPEPLDKDSEARLMASQVVCLMLIWMADAPTIEERGLRTSAALFCIRPDLIDGETLESLGDKSGRTKQYVHKLAESFRRRTGLTS